MATEKKELYVSSAPYGMYEIKYSGGGETPDALKGYFTREVEAERMIAFFQAEVRERVEKTTKSKRNVANSSN